MGEFTEAKLTAPLVEQSLTPAETRDALGELCGAMHLDEASRAP